MDLTLRPLVWRIKCVHSVFWFRDSNLKLPVWKIDVRCRAVWSAVTNRRHQHLQSLLQKAAIYSKSFFNRPLQETASVSWSSLWLHSSQLTFAFCVNLTRKSYYVLVPGFEVGLARLIGYLQSLTKTVFVSRMAHQNDNMTGHTC